MKKIRTRNSDEKSDRYYNYNTFSDGIAWTPANGLMYFILLSVVIEDSEIFYVIER
jgi:hypothetical protein